MAKMSKKFSQLLDLYKKTDIPFPHLKPASVAQWIEESGRGKSELARKYNNFAGIKYRPELKDFARRVLVDASDGRHYYAHFFDLQSFIEGYWANLDRAPYKGWQDAAATPLDFIRFIGPVWAENPNYVAKLSKILPEAIKLVGSHLFPAAKPVFDTVNLEKFIGNPRLQQILLGFFDDRRFLGALQGSLFAQILSPEPLALPAPMTPDDKVGCCEGNEDDGFSKAPEKPQTSYIASPNWSSRNGVRIDTIVMHYTVSRSIDSVVSQFRKTRGSRRSAHYIIGRDGRLIQMVRDTRKAWHGNGKNGRSIGIEHVAMPGQKIAKAQEKTSIALLRWLMAEYHIPKANIIPHKCVPRATKCCGDLFAAYKSGGDPYTCKAQMEALQKWLSTKGIS